MIPPAVPQGAGKTIQLGDLLYEFEQAEKTDGWSRELTLEESRVVLAAVKEWHTPPLPLPSDALGLGLAKLRRATELALAYSPVSVPRAEAHAILDDLERLRVRCDQQEREIKLSHALVDHLNASVTWEKTEHDKARDEWLVMRASLINIHKRLSAALETVEPPDKWEPSWADYGDGLEADPYGWLATLVAEVLDEYPAPLDYDAAASASLVEAEGGE